MSLGALSLATGTPMLALAAAAQLPSDLELYAASSLSGLHAHPVGLEGNRLELAERLLERRRARLGAWLDQRYGEAAVRQIDETIADEMHSIHWVRGPTLEEERTPLAQARRNILALEGRVRRARGQH